MRHVALAAAVLAAVPAAAQEQVNRYSKFIGGANGLDIVFTEPQAPNQRIDCVITMDNCQPLNQAACATTDSRPIKAALLPSANLVILSGAVLVIWVEKGESKPEATCNPFAYGTTQGTGTGTSNTQQLITQVTLSSAADLARTFPSTSGTDFPLATGDFLRAGTNTGNLVTDNCTTPLEDQFYRLCFGVDLNPTATTTANGKSVEANEPQAWLRILVDTKPPAGVESVEVESLDGRIRLLPSLTGSTRAFEEWEIRAREGNGTAFSCDALDASFTPRTPLVSAEAATHPQPEISTPNNVPIEGCIAVIDKAGNRGAAHSFSAMAVNECDFIECYPGELEGGYCGAALGPAWAAVLLSAGLLRRFRRRCKRQGRAE